MLEKSLGERSPHYARSEHSDSFRHELSMLRVASRRQYKTGPDHPSGVWTPRALVSGDELCLLSTYRTAYAFAMAAIETGQKLRDLLSTDFRASFWTIKRLRTEERLAISAQLRSS